MSQPWETVFGVLKYLVVLYVCRCKCVCLHDCIFEHWEGTIAISKTETVGNIDVLYGTLQQNLKSSTLV